MLVSLINLDTKTLLGVLVWGNIVMGAMVYLYQRFNEYKSDANVIRNMTAIRLLSALGFLLLFWRADIPVFITVNIGNTLLFTCHYLDARLMLDLTGDADQKLSKILTPILVVSVLVFNAVEVIRQDSSLRVAIASIILFSLFVLPTARLMLSPAVNRFKRSVGVLYVFLLLALIPRSLEAFLNQEIGVLSNNYSQTLMFLSHILIMMSNTILYLLFLRERSEMAIERMATYDQLTGIMNRHSFWIRGRHLFEQHRKDRTGLALLYLDIDFFKSVNDRYGHQFGDEVLIRFADLLKNCIRPSDLCCRIGGEEFVVVLSNANEHLSGTVGQRIMRELEACRFSDHPDFRITTSIGAVYDIPKPGDALEEFLKKGDKALYAAKETGRNRLVVYTDTLEP